MVQTHTITHPENLDLLAWEAFITRLRLFATEKSYLKTSLLLMYISIRSESQPEYKISSERLIMKNEILCTRYSSSDILLKANVLFLFCFIENVGSFLPLYFLCMYELEFPRTVGKKNKY